MNVIRYGAVCALLALAACVTAYKEVDERAPFATFEFSKGYLEGLGFGSSSLQQYSFVDNDACENARRAAWFTWTNDPLETRRVEPGRAVNLVAVTTRFQNTGVTWVESTPVAEMDSQHCWSMAQFVPQEGHAYAITHDPVCALRVVDKATSAPPQDLVVRDRMPECPPGTVLK